MRLVEFDGEQRPNLALTVVKARSYAGGGEVSGGTADVAFDNAGDLADLGEIDQLDVEDQRML